MIKFSPLTEHYVERICSWAPVPSPVRFKLAAFMAMSEHGFSVCATDPVLNRDAIGITFWRGRRRITVVISGLELLQSDDHKMMFADLVLSRCANAIELVEKGESDEHVEQQRPGGGDRGSGDAVCASGDGAAGGRG